MVGILRVTMRALWWGCVGTLMLTAAAAAQQGPPDAAQQDARRGVRLLPEVRYMQAPVADPVAPRLALSILSTNLLATQGPERPAFDVGEAAAREAVAAVGIGAVFPLVELARWDGGGAQLVVDGRVFARFRIELPGRDDMGQDWYVGGAVEGAHERWSGRVAVMHRSSHLGDEFVEATAAERIEFGGEELELRVAYEVPGFARVYGGGNWIFRSYLGWDPRLRALDVRDRGLIQMGLDREWRMAQDPRFTLFAGADYLTAQRTGWHPTFAAAAGAGIRTQRALRLTLRAFSGRSHMGEFFLTPEHYIALEVAAEF
jgi:hypothetical protein